MTSVLKKHSTSIILSDVKFDQGMNDDVFTIENLKAELNNEKALLTKELIVEKEEDIQIFQAKIDALKDILSRKKE